MDGAALKDRSFHDDIVLRMVFVGINEAQNSLTNEFANANFPVGRSRYAAGTRSMLNDLAN
jgi:hypothetical protein